jgi:membrane-bound lytic murein transglycosylase D
MAELFARRFAGVFALIALLALFGVTPNVRAQAIDGLAAIDGSHDAVVDVLAQQPLPPPPPPAPDVLPSTALQGVIVGDLQVTGPSIPIPLNQRVLDYVSLFQGRLHEFMEDGMRRGSKYLPMIQGVLRAEGLPLDLAYVPLVESAFNPNALSKARAKGVWQFMKGTALENGLKSDWYIDERSDPEKATKAAANYLKYLADFFDGDWHLALASYNGGPGRVQQAIRRGGRSDFWQLSAKPRLLPRETRDYVPMILAAIVIARNPAQYGFAFEKEDLRPFETVSLPRPVDLHHIATWTGTTVDEIQALNPELRRKTTPIGDAQYSLKVPPGTSLEISRRMDESPEAELVSMTWYTVKSGDTIAGIAKKLRVTRADLSEANSLGMSSRLAAGQKLIVPPEATASARAAEQRSATSSKAPARKKKTASSTSSTASKSTVKKKASAD